MPSIRARIGCLAGDAAPSGDDALHLPVGVDDMHGQVEQSDSFELRQRREASPLFDVKRGARRGNLNFQTRLTRPGGGFKYMKPSTKTKTPRTNDRRTSNPPSTPAIVSGITPDARCS